MKKWLVSLLLIVICLVPLQLRTADASIIYMFTESGNDNNVDEVEALINRWFALSGIPYHADLELLAKYEADGHEWPTGTSGEWTYPETVKYFSLKAGNEYAMFWVNPPATSGYYSTGDGGLVNWKGVPHDLSHITFWTNEGTHPPDNPPTATPEPNGSVLLGLGLLATANRLRRKMDGIVR